MAEAARVSSIDAIREFRAAVIEFGHTASTSLGEAQSDVQRTVFWLQNDQLQRWQREVKARNKRLAEARSAVEQKEIQKASTTLERRALAQAQARVAEAEDKVRLVKRWMRELERELVKLKAGCQRVNRTIDGEVPRVVARMDRMLESLEQYVRLRAESDPSASSNSAETAASQAVTGESGANDDSEGPS